MTQLSSKLNKVILVSGTVIVIAAFVNVVTTINSSINTVSGNSCVVSAFAG